MNIKVVSASLLLVLLFAWQPLVMAANPVGTVSNTATGTADTISDTATGTAGTISDTATGTAGTVSDTATGTAGTISDTAKGTAGTISDTATGTAGTVSDTATGTAGTISDTATGTAGAVSDTATGVAGTVSDTANTIAIDAVSDYGGAFQDGSGTTTKATVYDGSGSYSKQPTGSVPNLATMVKNLSTTMPQLMRLVTALAYVMGFFLVMKGIMEFKHFGESRTMMSREHSVLGPITYLFVGAALIYLPSSVQVGLSTFWNDPSPMAYLVDTNDPWSGLVKDVFLIVQLVGVIALIRGLLMLAKLAGHHGGGGHATMGRAMTHIIGGVFCINMYGVITMVWTTLALGGI